MEKFCVIIPNRPGREKLYDFCLWQISRMTVKPDRIYNIDLEAITESPDIGMRLWQGVDLANTDGFDLCFVLENDDNYPANYFERFGEMKEDFFGSESTLYYHIKNKTWHNIRHPGRSSLCTTGFRVSALYHANVFKRFDWNSINEPFVDIALWEFVRKRKDLKIKFISDTGAIGIKGHGIGKAGGKGHRFTFISKDPDYAFLKSKVDKESFDFYMDLINDD